MNNFSAWVRRKLLEDIEETGFVEEKVLFKYECKLCGLNYTRPFIQDWNCQGCFASLTEVME